MWSDYAARRSQRTWSNCVLCIPLILRGGPNECWLHSCHACVITTWRLGFRTTRGACNFHNNNHHHHHYYYYYYMTIIIDILYYFNYLDFGNINTAFCSKRFSFFPWDIFLFYLNITVKFYRKRIKFIEKRINLPWFIGGDSSFL